MKKDGGRIMRRVTVLACMALMLTVAAGAQMTWVVCLDGSQETPTVDTEATGLATVELSQDMTQLVTHVEHDVMGATASHINTGAPGQAGPVTHGFRNPASPIDDIWDNSSMPPLRDSLADLLAGKHVP